LPKFYLKKKTDFTGFFIIKPSHPDGLKKAISGWKNPAVGALLKLTQQEATSINHSVLQTSFTQLESKKAKGFE